MDDLVSVIIVNWNGKKWLKKCLDSLICQTYKNIEIIVVDNNSTDDSVTFLTNEYPILKIIKNDTNAGYAKGNNLGINNASGNLILLLNSDTWCDRDFIAVAVSNFYEKKCDVFGATETEYENPQYKTYKMSVDPFGYFVTLTKQLDRIPPFYISGACLLFRKNLYLETGGLDDDFFMYSEEVDWFWRLQLMKKNIYQDMNLFIHHASAGSIAGGMQYKKFLWRNQNILQMLLKNYNWINLLWVLPIYFVQNILEIIVLIFILKPKIAWSYIEGWWFNVRHLKQTLIKRKFIQKARLVSDWEIIKGMYFGFGKIQHLRSVIFKQ
jgi:GT2 family glycosyltransferase